MVWRDWSIHAGEGVLHERDEYELFPDRQWVLPWLRQFRRNSFRMAEFRRLLADTGSASIHPLDDEAVLEQVAWGLHVGRFRLIWEDVADWRERSRAVKKAAQPQPASSAPPPPRPSPRPPAPEPVVEEPTFPAEIDALAIAVSQKEAARLGIPFCEECARMALANHSI